MLLSWKSHFVKVIKRENKYIIKLKGKSGGRYCSPAKLVILRLAQLIERRNIILEIYSFVHPSASLRGKAKPTCAPKNNLRRDRETIYVKP